MRIPLDRESSQPLYRQIGEFLRQQIRSGALAAETRLPASRELAAELGVSRLTV
jgi:DNA-binding GntR family transcriptional regulator